MDKMQTSKQFGANGADLSPCTRDPENLLSGCSPILQAMNADRVFEKRKALQRIKRKLTKLLEEKRKMDQLDG